jgi:hypothetical protein
LTKATAWGAKSIVGHFKDPHHHRASNGRVIQTVFCGKAIVVAQNRKRR